MTTEATQPILVRLLGYALALASPPLALALLSRFAFSDQVGPDFVLNVPNSELPANLFTGLSADLLKISAGIAVSTVVVFRLHLRIRQGWAGNTMLVAAMAAALLSSFSGLRFRYEIAQLARLNMQDLDPVLWRLHVQGLFLIAQLSLLCLMAVRYHFHGEAKHAAT